MQLSSFWVICGTAHNRRTMYGFQTHNTQKNTNNNDRLHLISFVAEQKLFSFIYLCCFFSSIFYVHWNDCCCCYCYCVIFLLRSLSFLMSWLTNFFPAHPSVCTATQCMQWLGVVSRNLFYFISLSLRRCHTTFNVHILCTYYCASPSISSVFLSLSFSVRFLLHFFVVFSSVDSLLLHRSFLPHTIHSLTHSKNCSYKKCTTPNMSSDKRKL